MAKHLKYYGEFVSYNAHSHRINIYVESETAFTPKEVFFPGESPLVIEWGSKEKYDVIHGSSATLKVFAEKTMQLEDMYQVEYGNVRMDVWRDGELYWSGCIDTELYEAPYETWTGEISLTFSDFGYLSRAKFDMAVGFYSIKEVIAQAIYKTQCVRTTIQSDFDDSFEYSTWVKNIDWSKMLLGTTDVDGNEIVQNAYVRTDNFYDEDGEAKTWNEVITGILQPLNVHLVQLGGMMFLYDLNSLAIAPASDLVRHRIYWTADRQDLSIDKTYNNIRIEWSPYAQVDNLLPTECWDSSVETPVSKMAINNLNGLTLGDARYFTYPLNSDDSTFQDPGFTLWTSAKCKNITLGRLRKAFKIVPQYDGEECEGVAAYWRTFMKYTDGSAKKIDSTEMMVNPIGLWSEDPNQYDVLFTTPHSIVPPNTGALQLCVKMETLIDCRINPFEEPFAYVPGGDGNCKANMDRFNARAQFLYIPIRLHYKPIGSTVDYVYDNVSMLNNRNLRNFSKTLSGTWKESSNTKSYCWLAYYLPTASERKESTAVCKFAYNRQCIGPHGYNLDTTMTKMDDGQYVPFPSIADSKGGEVWVEVMGSGWLVARYDATVGSEDHNKFTNYVKNDLSFALVKIPEIELVSSNPFVDLTKDNIVYNAKVNEYAKEELSLSTICGSSVDGVPTARGAYFDEDGNQHKQFTRMTFTGTIEQLLCGTLFSNYHEKMEVLSGECKLEAKRFLSYTEDLQTFKLLNATAYYPFICSGETQDLRADTTQATFVKLNGDFYTKVN